MRYLRSLNFRSPTIEQLLQVLGHPTKLILIDKLYLQEMSAPIAEPIAAIDSKIINKIVKAYQLKLKSDSEARGVKRKRESDADITEPHKKRKEANEDDTTTSEGDYKKLMEDAKQLKRQGDEHKQTSEGAAYYLHSALTYARATLVLEPHSRAQLYRATAQLLGPSVSSCLTRGDEQRTALCYKVMAFCYARMFTLHRDKCERDVRHVRSLAAGHALGGHVPLLGALGQGAQTRRGGGTAQHVASIRCAHERADRARDADLGRTQAPVVRGTDLWTSVMEQRVAEAILFVRVREPERERHTGRLMSCAVTRVFVPRR
jgi:hypothetical protein